MTAKQREFFRELSIIILGVLIALAINEIADLIGWRVKTHQTETRIADQMDRDQIAFAKMIDWSRCAEALLTDLDAVLVDAQGTARLPDIGVMPAPELSTLTDANWQTTIGNDVAAHMSGERAERYARYYAAINRLSDDQWKLAQAWSKLTPIYHAPGPIQPQRADSLRSIVAELQFLLQSRASAIHLAMHESQKVAPVSRPVGPSSCRPLMVDLKPLVRKAAVPEGPDDGAVQRRR